MPKATDKEIIAATRELQAARVASEAAYDAELAAQRALRACRRNLDDAQDALRRANEGLADLLDRDHRETHEI